jgi:tetratricopeptide (TPR) repeat protein
MDALIAEVLAAEGDLKGPSPDAWFERLDAAGQRLDDALAWLLENDRERGLCLAGAVWPYWLARGLVDDGRNWFARLLAGSDPDRRTEARAKALYGAGTLAFIQGDKETALPLYESLAIAYGLADRSLEADALIGLARVALLDDEPCVMEEHARASLEAARAADDQMRSATALHHVVEALRRQRRYDEALPLYHESVEAHRALGDRRGVALELHNLGNLARLSRDSLVAADRFRESLELAAELKNARLIGYCLLGLAHLAADLGEWQRVARLLGASEAAFSTTGATLDPDYLPDRERTRSAAEAALGPDSWADEVALGASLGLEAAVREGLAETSSHSRA